MFIADSQNSVVRKVSGDGTISTIAGGGFLYGAAANNVSATTARLTDPLAVAVDPAGNVYIAVVYNIVIQKVTPEGIISTVAGNGSLGYSGDGGLADQAQLGGPQGVAVDSHNNVYIADYKDPHTRPQRLMWAER